MTLEDWLACADAQSLQLEFSLYPDRKLHLLAAAFLRRVWGKLPSDHSRAAVVATEQYADGLITADALLWARSQAERESAEQVWLGEMPYGEYDLLYPEDRCCSCCGGWQQYECRVAKRGGILDGARNGLGEPAFTAARAAFHAVQLKNPIGYRSEGALWDSEWRSVFATVLEVLGECHPDPRWPRWRTTDVVALARGIHRDQAFDRLPILADALQDAGCDDPDVLQHCRAPGGGSGEPVGGSPVQVGHVRGCWVVDLAMGFG